MVDKEAEEAPSSSSSSRLEEAPLVCKPTSTTQNRRVAAVEKEMFGIRGVVLANAMGLCGIVLVALGATLEGLASQCGTTATKAGTVFLARGFGACLGCCISILTYSQQDERKTRTAITAAQLGIALGIVSLNFVTNMAGLHALWGLIGTCTATLDTGVQIATLETKHEDAAFWLNLNTVSFAIAGALVPLVQLATDSMTILFVLIAIASLANAAALWRAPLVNFRRDRMPFDKWGIVEIIFAAICFWLIGGKVVATSYVTTYVNETGVVASGKIPWVLFDLWAAVIVGRLLGFKGQIDFITSRTPHVAHTIHKHLVAWLCLAAIGVCVLIFSKVTAKPPFWLGLALYGLGNGPAVGYCYDLVQRILDTNVVGLAIIMLGLNLGSSLVPFFTSFLWLHLHRPQVLTDAMLASILLPLPLLFLAPRLL